MPEQTEKRKFILLLLTSALGHFVMNLVTIIITFSPRFHPSQSVHWCALSLMFLPFNSLAFSTHLQSHESLALKIVSSYFGVKVLKQII